MTALRRLVGRSKRRQPAAGENKAPALVGEKARAGRLRRVTVACLTPRIK